MILNQIVNPTAFFDVVKQCRGCVTYVGKDGTQRDLKHIAEQLSTINDAVKLSLIPQIELLVSEPSDRHRMLRFMMEANYA